MDDDQYISWMEEVLGELRECLDRIISAEHHCQTDESQAAKQELAAARFTAQEAMERYRGLIESIRQKRK
jgi:hypothetical protein